MSDLISDNEDNLAKIPFSWKPPNSLSTFPLFLSEYGRLSFFIIDDPISKQRIEKIISDFGGKVCRNAVLPCTVVLVAEDTKPLPHWGAVYSRRWVKDSVTACCLKELNNYLIEGCQHPTVNEHRGSLTTSLFFEEIEFRESPLSAAFFCKDVFVKDDAKISFKCSICRGVERFENGESPCKNNLVPKNDDANVVASATNGPDDVGSRCNPVTVSSSSDCFPRIKTSTEDPVKGPSTTVNGVKKVMKRKLTNPEDLINISECEVRLDRIMHEPSNPSEKNFPLDHRIRTSVGDLACRDRQKLGKAMSPGGKARKSHRPVDSDENNSCQKPENAMKSTSNKVMMTSSSNQSKGQVDKRDCGDTERGPDGCLARSSKNRVSSSKVNNRVPRSDQSDSDDSIPDLKNWGKQKKFTTENKHTKSKFSREEKVAILRFILNKKAFNRLKSDALYREMEERNICPKRTYQSMKNHFLKTILKELDTFEFLTQSLKQKLRGEANHVY